MQDLDSLAFAVVGGTVTGGTYDTGRIQAVEVFARGGTQVGTVTASVVVHVDAQDEDGNWFNDAVGTFAVGTAESVAKAYRRGENIGAASPAVLGVKGRFRAVVAGSMELGMNIVGY